MSQIDSIETLHFFNSIPSIILKFNLNHLLSVLVILSGGISYSLFFLAPNVSSSLKFPMGFCDLLAICACAFHILKCIVFLLHLLVLIEFVYHFYLLDLAKLVEDAIKGFKQGAY